MKPAIIQIGLFVFWMLCYGFGHFALGRYIFEPHLALSEAIPQSAFFGIFVGGFMYFLLRRRMKKEREIRERAGKYWVDY